MTGFIVFGHGSRVESANASVRDVAQRLAASAGFAVVPAFLELGEPDLAGAVDQLAVKGAERIIVIPYFLTLGTHLQRDLPKLLEASAARYPLIAMRLTAPLEGHPALLEALLDRAAHALTERAQ